jgi:hypothetical protein
MKSRLPTPSTIAMLLALLGLTAMALPGSAMASMSTAEVDEILMSHPRDEYYAVLYLCLYGEGSVIAPLHENVDLQYLDVSCPIGYTSYYYQKKFKAEKTEWQNLEPALQTKYLEDFFLETFYQGFDPVYRNSDENGILRCEFGSESEARIVTCETVSGQMFIKEVEATLANWITKNKEEIKQRKR